MPVCMLPPEKKSSVIHIHVIKQLFSTYSDCTRIWKSMHACRQLEHEMPADHYCDVIMSVIASQITGVSIVYSTVYSGADKRKHQSSASLAFVRGIHRWPVNSPYKGPVMRTMFPFDDVITTIL